MILDNVKMLGLEKYIIKDDHDNTYGVRYQSLLHTNYNDSEFIQILLSLGFDIVKCHTTYAKMILPVGWIHLKLDKTTEIVIDEQGRERIKVDRALRKATIIRKISYEIQIISTIEEFEKTIIQVVFTDQGKPFDTQVVNPIEVCKMMKHYSCTSKEVGPYVEDEAKVALNLNYPDWEDVTAYW